MKRNAKNIQHCIRQSFLNSLFIEVGESHLFEKEMLAKEFPFINENEKFKTASHILFFENTFMVAVSFKSQTFQHEFIDHYYIKNTEVDFEHWIGSLALHYLKGDQEKANLFVERVLTSIQNTNDELHAHFPLKNKIFDFKNSESLLVFGHYAHPYPKLRETEILQDIDLTKALPIKWLLVKKELLNIEASKSFNENRALKELLALAQSENVQILNGYLPMPMHPLQWLTMKDHELKKYIASEEVIETTHETVMSPTTSIRSLFSDSLPWMMKFSLSVRLTNSIRHLKSHEVRRGMILHEISEVSNYKNEISHLEILQEPFFLALKKEDGNILEESIVVFRENPFRHKDNNTKHSDICLAVLTQELPHKNTTLLNQFLQDLEINPLSWYKESYLPHVLAPILELQSLKGILLGAHQQNIILKLDEKFNVLKTYYRDTQGSGFLEEAKNKYDAQNIEATKNFIPLEISNMLVGYYLIINSTLGTIRALTQNAQEETVLVNMTRDFLQKLHQQMAKENNLFLKFLLVSPFLRIKNNFRCSLQNDNENAMDNPFSLYRTITNPFYSKEFTEGLAKMNTETTVPYTLTNNIHHPIRPKFSEGEILYTREIPKLQKTIRIRVIDRNQDLEIFHDWHNQSRVANFWELNQSKPELLAYISKGLQDPHLMPVMVEFGVNGNYESVGYFEIYWTKEDRLGPYYDSQDYDRGFHLLIGNAKYLGFDNTDAILKHVCNYIFESHPETNSIMGEPRHDNEKILRYLETFTAWERLKVFDFPHKRAVLIRCDRTKFFAGNYI